jgi:hypothetical protein
VVARATASHRVDGYIFKMRETPYLYIPVELLYIFNSTGNDKTVAIAYICDSTGALTTATNGKLLVQQVE